LWQGSFGEIKKKGVLPAGGDLGKKSQRPREVETVPCSGKRHYLNLSKQTSGEKKEGVFSGGKATKRREGLGKWTTFGWATHNSQ